MLREPLGQPLRRAALLADAQLQRLEAARAEERLERPHHAAGGVLHEVQLVEQRLVADDQRPAEQVAVAAEVLRGRVHHDVGPQLQRPREHRRGERAVDAQQRAAPMGDFGARRDVGDRHQRIAGRFDPHELAWPA